MARQFAVRCGLLAFAATTLDGVLGGVMLGEGLWTALGRMVAFYGLGLICGDLAQRLVDEAAQRDLDHWKTAADAQSA